MEQRSVRCGDVAVQVLELARQPAVIQAMKHSGIGGAYSTNTYAMIFLAGLLKEYRPLAEDWGRIRRCAWPAAPPTQLRLMRLS